ncbi:MAG: dTDP-glucose 4,6-dehydratase, partial [Myxococcota bacterium]|nr:dTDP-glucose 4,6-dehydratase [Myxococcota bacterium]
GSAFVRAALGLQDGPAVPAATEPLESARHAVARLVVLDKLTYAGRRENLDAFEGDRRFVFVEGDVCDRPLVDKLFAEHDFDAVVHLAAESHVDRSIADGAPFVRTNVDGTFVLLDAARAAWVGPDLRRFVYVSSDEVYGALGHAGHFDESSPLAPRSPYAASKAAGDLFARAYFVTHGLPVVVTHGSNTYGPRQSPEKLIARSIANALAGTPMPVYGAGKQVRQWLYVDDHARGLWQALLVGRPGETYDLGGTAELENRETVGRVAAAVDRALGRAPGTSLRLVTFVADRAGHDFRYALDSAKARQALRWRPAIAFDEGLAHTIAWYIANPAWLERAAAAVALPVPGR